MVCEGDCFLLVFAVTFIECGSLCGFKENGFVISDCLCVYAKCELYVVLL